MKLLTFIFLLVLSISAKAQHNLVPNPSFEDTLFCPYQYNQIEALSFWENYGKTPESINSCAPFYLNMPNCSFGYQFSHSGQGMAGLITYRKPNSPDGPNYREFIGAPLINTLQVGVRYFISFFINCGNAINISIATNNFGCRFSTISYSAFNSPEINNLAHIYTTQVISDTVNWTKISGSFIADSSYNYFILGNFFDDVNTDTLNLGPFPDWAYYFVDDVCVTTDSLYNETWTGLNYIKKEEVSLWPNPASDYFEFKAMQVIDEINVYDFSGRLVRSEKINSNSGRINLSGLPAGVYLATFRKEAYISSYRFSKY